MIMDVYDSFVDPERWPAPNERAAVAEIYGWNLDESTSIVQAEYKQLHPAGVSKKTPPS